jgi:HD superfamily phosphohydrolase
MTTEFTPEPGSKTQANPTPVAAPKSATPAEKLPQAPPSGAAKPIGAAGKVIRDAVHDLIRIEPGDDVLLHLINTPEFQRLRRVRQLGVSSMTYPGAEHSRFTHSLGVMNFAQRILGSLLHRYRKDSAATDLLNTHQLTVKAAALLHDVGHGPFSHMMERAFSVVANHEDKTTELIRSPDSQIPAVLSRYSIDPQAVCDIIDKVSEYRLLVDIVSSQLDADRMDYILRDALATGVRYGAFDSEWLINSLCIGTEPRETGAANPKLWRLCLEERRGLYSAEQLIIARMHMSLQVYFHKATRAWEAHLLCLFNLAAQLAKGGKLPQATPDIVRRFFAGEGKLSHTDFLLFDEAILTHAFQVWSLSAAPEHRRLAELASGFLTRQKCFLCQELKPLGFTKSTKLQKQLSAHGQEGFDWLLDEISFNSYKDFGAVFKSSHKPGADEISTGAILVSDGNLGSESFPVESRSHLFADMGRNPAESVIRLYYHRDIAGAVKKVLAG